MKVSLCQLNSVWEDKAASHARASSLLDLHAGEVAGSLIVLPEMFATGFSLDVEKVRETDEKVSERFLAALAVRHNAHVMGGVVNCAPGEKARNESLLFDPSGKELCRYVKRQPFTLGGEAASHAWGDRTLVLPCGEFQLSPFVCYDLRFPEIFRRAAKHGGELFVVIASWPCLREGHWTTLLRARAIENQAWVVGVNRCGTDPKFRYTGRSIVVNPHGDVVADAGNGECVVTAELDRAVLSQWRKDFPALADIRWC
jgi:predicted amidohydrolase